MGLKTAPTCRALAGILKKDDQVSKDSNPQKSKRPGRALRVALVLSLAVNLLVAGAVAGAFYRADGAPAERAQKEHGRGSFGVPYVRALSKEDRKAVGDAMRAAGLDRKVGREVRLALYGEVLIALRAEPFAVEPLVQVLGKQSQAAKKVLDVSQAAWLAHLTAMDAQTRAAYAERLEKVLSRKGRKRKER